MPLVVNTAPLPPSGVPAVFPEASLPTTIRNSDLLLLSKVYVPVIRAPLPGSGESLYPMYLPPEPPFAVKV